MEKDRSFRILTVVALLIGVASLSLGFAAYSQSLNISATATVQGNPDNLKVVFSKEATSPVTGQVTADAGSTSNTGEAINITSGSTTISGLKATFAEAGTVQYTFYAHNNGEIVAYLRNITFTGSNTCTPTGANAADSAIANSACNDITLQITAGGQTVTTTTAVSPGAAIAVDGGDQIIVEIIYNPTVTPNGDFDVTLPSIQLDYSSVSTGN